MSAQRKLRPMHYRIAEAVNKATNNDGYYNNKEVADSLKLKPKRLAVLVCEARQGGVNITGHAYSRMFTSTRQPGRITERQQHIFNVLQSLVDADGRFEPKEAALKLGMSVNALRRQFTSIAQRKEDFTFRPKGGTVWAATFKPSANTFKPGPVMRKNTETVDYSGMSDLDVIRHNWRKGPNARIKSVYAVKV